MGGAGVPVAAVRETAFWNSSIARVYYTCLMNFGGDFGEQPLAPSSALQARYVVVPISFGDSGSVLARDREGKLVLVAPRAGELRVPAALSCRS